MNYSGNSHDRRKELRRRNRQWAQEPGRFNEGERVKLTSDKYGSRYARTKVYVMHKADKPGYWFVLSNRRVSPLVVAEEHLMKQQQKSLVPAA